MDHVVVRKIYMYNSKYTDIMQYVAFMIVAHAHHVHLYIAYF